MTLWISLYGWISLKKQKNLVSVKNTFYLEAVQGTAHTQLEKLTTFSPALKLVLKTELLLLAFDSLSSVAS